MGGKGKGKESKGYAANAEDDKAAARAKLRREIQQAKADLVGKKSDRQEKREETGKGHSTWEKREEPGKGRHAWKNWDTDYNYKYTSSSGGQGSSDYKSRYDNRDQGSSKAWNSDNRDKGSMKSSDFDNRDKGSTRWSNFDNRDKGSSKSWSFDNRDKGYAKESSFDSRDKGPAKGSSLGKEQDLYGKSKGKGKSKDKGKGDFEDSEPSMSLQDLEKRLTNSDDVPKAKAASSTTPLESKGLFCEVRKHTDMGCAVVSMESEAERDAVLELSKRSLSQKGRPQVDIAGVIADMRPHAEGNLGIFVAWGRPREKQSPLSPTAIAEAFDNLYREIKGMPISPTTQPSSITEPTKDQPQMRQEQPQSVPPMPPAQASQSQNAQAALFAAQRQMMMQQMALAAAGGQVQRPQAPQQNMQQMAAAFAAAGQALAQALNMPKAGNAGTGAATNFSSSTIAANTMGQQTQGFMRAEAPTFSPGVGQQNQWSQQMVQQNTDMTQMWYSNNSQVDTSSFGQQSTPERRPLQIVDPQSGKAIETPAVASSPSALDYLDVKPPTRRALTIVDPSSGKTVDTLAAVNFKPAEGKKLSIIDPSNGSTVKI